MGKQGNTAQEYLPSNPWRIPDSKSINLSEVLSQDKDRQNATKIWSSLTYLHANEGIKGRQRPCQPRRAIKKLTAISAEPPGPTADCCPNKETSDLILLFNLIKENKKSS